MGLVEFLLSSGNIVLLFSIILIVAIFAAKSGAKFGTPTLLLFLFIGMLFGSDGLGIQFNSSNTAQFIGMLALSVILFSGGMDTKYSEIRPVVAEGVVLATVGVFLTAALTGFFIYFISGVFGVRLSLTESFLFAAVMSSTDSASVFSILRSKKQGLKQNLRPLLELESGSNDPMAYILTIILVQAVSQGDINVWQSVLTFVMQMSIGAVAGYLLGRFAVYVLNHINLNNKSLYSVLLLALVYLIFSLTDETYSLLCSLKTPSDVAPPTRARSSSARSSSSQRAWARSRRARCAFPASRSSRARSFTTAARIPPSLKARTSSSAAAATPPSTGRSTSWAAPKASYSFTAATASAPKPPPSPR